MMVKKIIILMISVLTVVALSVFTCFGWTVFQAKVYGVEYGTSDPSSLLPAKYILSSGGGEGYRIGIFTDTVIASVTYLKIWFFVDVDYIQSFYITLRQTTLPWANVNLESYGVDLYKLNASLQLSGYTNIKNETVQTSFKEGDSAGSYSWFLDAGTSYSDKNVIAITIPLSTAVFGTSPAWFTVVDFTVNGHPVSDIKAYKNYELLEGVSEGMELGLIPDPDAILTSSNQVVGYYSDLGPVMLDTYMNANIIAPMLIITFTVGAAAYILFGKKV